MQFFVNLCVRRQRYGGVEAGKNIGNTVSQAGQAVIGSVVGTGESIRDTAQAVIETGESIKDAAKTVQDTTKAVEELSLTQCLQLVGLKLLHRKKN
jgi:orotate phosphoribosyltransferase